MSVSLLLLLALVVPVQEDPDALYREQYGHYVEIMEMTDPAAQAGAYLDFLEEGFDERLLGGVLGGLQGDLVALVEASPDDVYALADRWQQLRPEDQDPLVLSLQAAIGSNNHERIVEYGEQFYAHQPDPGIALVLAQSYSALGNEAKVAEYGGVAVENLPIEQTWRIAYQIAQQHERGARFPQAASLAGRILGGFSQAPEGVSASQWREIRIYLRDVIGRDHHESQRYRDAITAYESVLDLDPRSDKAWYFIADSYLRLGDGLNVSESMNAFAKASLLEGGYSARARDMLETIYSQNRGGSLDGLDEVINRNRRELNQ
jgi:tetratricopeptide (TPR) repeat protein